MWMEFVKKLLWKCDLCGWPPPRFWEKITFWFVCGVFPLWDEQRCIWVLSNMAGVLSIMVWRRIHLGFVIYGWVLSHMGSAKINLVFVKYGLGFVTWGQRRYTRDLSNMAWVLSLMGWRRIQFSFVIYGWGLSWVLSYMGSIQQQQLFMNSGRLG